ncbi:MAG: amidohydrolase family protein [Gammaproteobacteria bacterium]
MIFDTHAHVLSPDREAYPYGTLRGGAVPPVTPVVFTVEELIRQMDASGIARACLVQRATLYGYDNRYALDAAARFPDRLAPIVVLDAQEPDSAKNLTKLAAEHRLAGLRLVAPSLTVDDTAWLDSDPVLDFWAAASELKLPVTVILYRLNNTAGRSALARVARRFRDLPILVDHVGLPHPSTPEKKWGEAHGHDYSIPTGPDFGVAEYLAELGALPHVFFKVTDINFDRLEEAHLDAARFVRALADAFGANRLLWGSDVGQSPAPYVEKVARLHHAAQLLDEIERAALFGSTAMRLYGAALGER